MLRSLSEVKEDRDDPSRVFSLDSLKLEMKENDSTSNGVLDALIRENKITALMATSLMNDAAYAHDVNKNLMQMGEVLFASGDQAMKDVERIIALDDSDMDEIIEHPSTRVGSPMRVTKKRVNEIHHLIPPCDPMASVVLALAEHFTLPKDHRYRELSPTTR